MAGVAAVTSAAKRASVHKLSEEEFWALVAKIRSAHAAAAVQMRESYIAPDACDKWMKGQVDRNVPYQEKHVVQQVSIVGNMETFGLLPRGGAEDATKEIALKNAPAVVEFGAGRGYLTQMLADCYGIKNIFLVERRSYKLKADRSLRQNEGVKLERLRIDIEDLSLRGVKALSGSQYLAIGKHLCGPATDKAFLSGLGIAEEEFHAMTWFSSWAVDGDHSSQDSLESEDSSSEVIRNRVTEKPDPEIVGVERIIRGIPGVERSALGFMCKDVIDTGRLLWLRSKGLDADLVSYVPSDVSPENHLLMAKCRS
ncbi:tRNA guanosine-2'-O-methyltransferase TRM13 [Triticum urartu]|uniref:tRNA:m(4)X modification enzyme TRM13 n=1 Tax=Triticum urartu TaxID=4572 RepID=M7ZWY6_TRIUA|nr:tRNA guanosine-2'-O-methyltransferase TRM13 [Triticum urartu]